MNSVQKFVDHIAEYLLQSEKPLNELIVILPSERAKTYIQKSLFDKLQKPFFAPKMLTISQWVKQTSKKAIADKTQLLLDLYDIHCAYPSKDLDISFDEFLNWGSILISDFDEIERYLVDSPLLFRNLTDIKEIEQWSFDSEEELTENQRKYLAFWERLGSYYHLLLQKLSEKNAQMMGTAYRRMAENTILFLEEGKHYLFAGFNALSKAELTIFKNIRQAQRGEILIDGDVFYVNNKLHEAGYFLREQRDFLGVKELPLLRNELLTSQKAVELIRCSQETGQVKVAQTILNEIPKEERSETLVLLADEGLITPLLQNLPRSIEKANITLGLPLQTTSLNTWVELIFNIQEGFLRFQRNSIYYKDLLEAWNHPFFDQLLSQNERDVVYKKEQQIQRNNIIFHSLKSNSISPLADQILTQLFTPWKGSWVQAMEQIRMLNRLLFEGFEEQKADNKLERALVQRFDEVLVEFHNCVRAEIFPPMNMRSFAQLFRQCWAGETVAYYGNPTDGVQIMGLLETRLLDFKKLIVLGLNEGKMPPGNPINSLIPMDLRRFVGLPTMREKQGLFAHHFYRLLHGAEQIHITYSNNQESIGFSEKSRFVAQLEMELAKANPGIKWVNKEYTLSQEKLSSQLKSVQKNAAIEEQLDTILTSGVSPSLLKKFLTCPLDFYYRYVLKFGEEDKVEEELESNTFGTFVHEVLETLYTPYVSENERKYLTDNDIQKMLNDYEGLLHQEFMKHFNQEEQSFMTGKNFLAYNMAREMCKKFLESEAQFLKDHPQAQLAILALEKNVNIELDIPVFDKIKKVTIKGFLDRVDELNGEIRIVDYKSGRVSLSDTEYKPKELSVDDLVKKCASSKYLLQLYFYLYAYNQHEKGKQQALDSVIYSMINFKENPYHLTKDATLKGKMLELFPEVLSHILERMYDYTYPFEHNVKSKYCLYC